MGFLLRIMLATALVNLAPAVAQAKNAVASPAVQKEFDGFIGKFRAALKANDSAAVAGMTRLPFMNDKAIGDAAQFRAKTYPTEFTAKNRACIQRGKAVFDPLPIKRTTLRHRLRRHDLRLYRTSLAEFLLRTSP